MKRIATVLAILLLARAALAQGTDKPLNLKLPANLPASSRTASAPASATAPLSVDPVHSKDLPGTYYGDTSGHISNDDGNDDARNARCDDATYSQPQLHGSVGMGALGARHVNGSYQIATVNLSRALGSCDHPWGDVSISISGAQGSFHGH